MTRFFGGVAVRSLGLLLGAASLYAQAGYGVGVSLQDGVVVRQTSANPLRFDPPQFNPATQHLDLTGAFTIPTNRNIADFSVSVQGLNVRITPGGGVPIGGGIQQYGFTISIPLAGATLTPPLTWNMILFGGILNNNYFPAKLLIAELYDRQFQVLRARQLLTFFDGRFAPNFEARSGDRIVRSGLSLELTGPGLDKLEVIHAQRMPFPTKQAFNALLTAAFGRQVANEAPVNTTIKNSLRACRPIAEVPAFYDVPEYDTILAQAEFQYALYKAAKEYIDTGGASTALTALVPGLGQVASAAVLLFAAGVVNSSCVIEFVKPDHFEVCTPALRGVGKGLAVDSVRTVDLTLGANQVTPASFFSQPTLGQVQATVQGKFTNVFLRYSVDPTRTCAGRPVNTVSESNMTSRANVDTTRTCPLLEMRVDQVPSLTSVGHPLREVSADTRQIQLQAGYQPVPYFTTRGQNRTTVVSGWCDLNSTYQTASNRLLNQFWARIESVLSTVWKGGEPKTQQAKALDEFFQTWEAGNWGNQELVRTNTGRDHEFTFTYREPDSLNLRDRFFARLDTAAAIPGKQRAPFVRTQPTAFPCAHGFCPLFSNENGVQYDAAFYYSTGALNQIVAQLASTSLLTFNWQPTYQQLGAAPPAGKQPGDVAELNGTTLSGLHSAFSEMGGSPAAVLVRAIYPPFFFVNPQPFRGPGYVFGQVPLTYSTPHLLVEVSNNLGIWLKGAIYFYDENFQLNASAGAPFLSAAWAQDFSHQMALESKFTNCTWNFYGANPPGCPDAAFNGLVSRLRPLLRERLLYLASRFPAPTRFRTGQFERLLQTAAKYQEDNYVAFYGTLVE